MRLLRPSTLLLAATYVVVVAYVVSSSSGLPPRTASHFDGSGNANGWTTPHTYVTMIVGVATLLAMIGPLMALTVRSRASSTLNIPNREYWLAPERRDDTVGYVHSLGMIIACSSVAFIGVVHAMTLEANRQVPPHLPSRALSGLTLGIVAFSLALVVTTLLRFSNVPASRA
jgi:uncharacterized membrane protein